MGHIYNQEDLVPRKGKFKGVAVSVFVSVGVFVMIAGGLIYKQEISSYISEKFDVSLPMGELVRPGPEEVVEEDKENVKSKKIYSWVDEKGAKHFSNFGAPEDSDFTTEDELSPWQKRTMINIDRNVIYVPVEISQGKMVVATNMILDTGSNKTAVYADFAERLGIIGMRKSRMKLADGKSITSQIGVTARIKVGSKYISNKEVMIIDRLIKDKRISGLLGQDFLGEFSYKIDTGDSVIIWD